MTIMLATNLPPHSRHADENSYQTPPLTTGMARSYIRRDAVTNRDEKGSENNGNRKKHALILRRDTETPVVDQLSTAKRKNDGS